MARQIFLVVKHWPNGRVEMPEAWLDEAKAQESAQKLVEPGAYYTMSVWTCELKDMPDGEGSQ